MTATRPAICRALTMTEVTSPRTSDTHKTHEPSCSTRVHATPQLLQRRRRYARGAGAALAVTGRMTAYRETVWRLVRALVMESLPRHECNNTIHAKAWMLLLRHGCNNSIHAIASMPWHGCGNRYLNYLRSLWSPCKSMSWGGAACPGLRIVECGRGTSTAEAWVLEGDEHS